jgi:hypothetical protein
MMHNNSSLPVPILVAAVITAKLLPGRGLSALDKANVARSCEFLLISKYSPHGWTPGFALRRLVFAS